MNAATPLVAGENVDVNANLHIARDLTLDAAQAARASRTATKTLSNAQLKKLLDSRNDREVLDGLRKVISVSLPNSQYHCLYALATFQNE